MPFRRYAPAFLLAATLLLLVAFAPSRGARTSSAATFAPFDPGTSQSGGLAPGTAPGTQAVPGTPGTRATNGALVPGAPGTSGLPGQVAGPGGTSGTGSGGSTGDTSHCRNGKQFALPGFAAAPPCQPRFTGGDNGGATYRGVTKTEITVVFYRVKDNPAITAVLGNSGLVPTNAQLQDFLDAEQAFINKRYELWGRKVKIVNYQSPSCQGTPPSDDCFRQDARAIVATYHPFAVLFPVNATAPGFQDELSKAGVVNFGGLGLPSSFNTSRRPFRYDYTPDGDTEAELAGEFYCKQLANSPARFAGDATLRSTPRKAEILVPDSDETVQVAQRLQARINGCDHGGGAVIKTYAQDTSQAASQSSTLASQAKQNGITTLVYLTDPVLPIYLTPQLTGQNYFPENLLAGASFLDYDTFGQLYDQRQWANSFGLGDLAESQPPSQQDSHAAYVDGGGTGALYASSDGAQSYFSVLAAGLQQAGAHLDPGSFERGILTLPAYGGDRFHGLVQFGQGDYTGLSDVRITYYDPQATSPINGKQGMYRPLDGSRRHRIGTFSSTPLTIPGRS